MAEQVVQDVVDPVCGMTISPADSVGEVEHGGHTYYFCNDSCLERFKANPHHFVGPATERSASHVPADADAEYTCPMHPEVRQKGPGSCPICGMALEPVNVSLEEQPNEELEDMTRRFRWSLALTVPILLVMVDEFLPGHPLHARIDARLLNWIELALATPVVLWGGWPFFVRGMGVAREPPPQHVHAHRAGRGRRVRLQRGRHPRARSLSARVSHGRRRRRVFRAGCGDRRAGAARPGARAARAQPHRAPPSAVCSASRRRRRGASMRMEPSGTCRSPMCTSAIGCACGPASASPSTASCSRVRAASTNRW